MSVWAAWSSSYVCVSGYAVMFISEVPYTSYLFLSLCSKCICLLTMPPLASPSCVCAQCMCVRVWLRLRSISRYPAGVVFDKIPNLLTISKFQRSDFYVHIQMFWIPSINFIFSVVALPINISYSAFVFQHVYTIHHHVSIIPCLNMSVYH